MSVTIHYKPKAKAKVKVEEMIQGYAYKDAEGDIYICNICLVETTTIYAFSLCGRYTADMETTQLFTEIDLEIREV